MPRLKDTGTPDEIVLLFQIDMGITTPRLRYRSILMDMDGYWKLKLKEPKLNMDIHTHQDLT